MIKSAHFTLNGAAGKTILGDATYDDKNPNSATIIFIHGFKGFKDWGAHHLTAAFFASNGYRYIKFNLSHSGVTAQNPNDVTDMEAFASNTISKELSDVNSVIDYVSSTFPSTSISLIGHSRGGGLAIIQGARDSRISKLITWSAISDFSSLWKKEQETEWIKTGRIYVENARTKEKMPLNSTLLDDFNHHKDQFNILNAAKRIKIPWLILHGDDDINVKFSVALDLAQKQLNAKIQKIEGANHVYGASHPYTADQLPKDLQEVVEKTLAFLNRN
ncbi:alpha/beta hydrolase family protein [Pedobacter nyackensis]|uniref:Pimeloyl-ACP methyl ester carboxylesterase n=1 Tax=Pedobacter nyackensis TaxID=475255 RepID=A0A1W2D2L7_9SPHI|nr:alpha/beta hydrolase [Pedobacter nyackensis]SMC91332.1 Pimeloyl-ACP methyl ester carboxylesterase [Pedobacter nyackensis]